MFRNVDSGIGAIFSYSFLGDISPVTVINTTFTNIFTDVIFISSGRAIDIYNSIFNTTGGNLFNGLLLLCG